MEEKRFYDKINNRLVYVKKEATDDYWDSHWERIIQKVHSYPPKNRFFVYKTQKYLPKGSKILEGGCGMGDKVFAFDKAGFDSYGVDFAEKTVEIINKDWPHLNVIKGDVFNLPYEDNYFDGYWSLGVIEHFYDGFDGITNEMKRVVKKGGYIFLTFPSMSRIRNKKVQNNEFEEWDEKYIDSFYQFALDTERVIKEFEKYNFECVEKSFEGNLKGLKDELIYLKKSVSLISKLPLGLPSKISFILDKILRNYSSHMSLLIFRNKD